MTRMTSFHKELLVEFIEKNSVMVKMKVSQRKEARNLWEDLARELSKAGAVRRSGEEWRKAWGELLCRTKKLARMYMNNHKEEKITPLDHRILAAGRGNLESKLMPCRNIYGQVSAGKRDFGSDVPDSLIGDVSRKLKHSEDDAFTALLQTTSPQGDISESGNCFSNLDISTIYPKWLIDIENKRAETEKLNAITAAKNAEAGFIQAKALEKLAEAAHIQAEALMKIAKVMEDKNGVQK